MGVEICACGHARARHLIRWALPDQVRQQITQGISACYDCRCDWYTHTLTAKDSDRNNFRVKPKQERGNFGSGHPLMVGVMKSGSGSVEWEPLKCAACAKPLEPSGAIVLDSSFYCGPCFLGRWEVYVG